MNTEKTRQAHDQIDTDADRDPITGAAGARPAGSEVGAVGGGPAGVATWTFAGPAEAAGRSIDRVAAGGLTEKGVGEEVDATVKNRYWKDILTWDKARHAPRDAWDWMGKLLSRLANGDRR